MEGCLWTVFWVTEKMHSLMVSSNFLSWQIKSMKNWCLYLQIIENCKAEKAAGKTISFCDSEYCVFPWKFHLFSLILVFARLLSLQSVLLLCLLLCVGMDGCKAAALLCFPVSISRGAFCDKSYCMTGKQECFHFMAVLSQSFNVLSLLSMLFSVTILGICSALGQAGS